MLDNVIFTGIKNDIAFVIEDRFIVLSEHQSTLSPNFPLRLFCYLAREYEKLCYTDAVYSKRQVKIPRPELYVFYDVVKVINVNYDKGTELLQKCRTMQEYSIFMRMIRQNFAQTGDLETAVKESICHKIIGYVWHEHRKRFVGSVAFHIEVFIDEDRKT